MFQVFFQDCSNHILRYFQGCVEWRWQWLVVMVVESYSSVQLRPKSSSTISGIKVKFGGGQVRSRNLDFELSPAQLGPCLLNNWTGFYLSVAQDRS